MSSVLSATSAIDEESRLYERVRDRDASALLESLDRVGPLVYCMALVHTGQPASAEELTASLFLSFWREPDAFPPSQGPLGMQLLRRMTEVA